MSLNIFSVNQFLKELKALHKRYKNIGKDLKQLKETLTDNPKAGIALAHNCYKIRIANSSVPTGKSGGFRVIYYYVDNNGTVYLLSIYSKSDLATVSDEKIVGILKKEGIIA